MTKDQLYTLRWAANKIVSTSTEKAIQELAKNMVVEITKALGEQVAAEPIKKPTVPAVKAGKGPLAGDHIAIIVGHTKKAQGAYSKHMKQSEYVYNSDLALKQKAAVESYGGSCSIHFRDVLGVKGAYKEAIALKPLAIIEDHFNAANGKASGAEVLFADHFDKAGLKELELAQIMSAGMANALGTPNRGAKRLAKGQAERGLQNVSQSTNIPCVLIESGFGDNASVDAPAMLKHKTALAVSTITSIMKWKGLQA